jgi:uncharacterized protein (DUF362 family)
MTRLRGSQIEKAKALKKWLFYKDILEADRFINIPVAKQHAEARLTMCLKNMMGAIGGWRGRIHVGLHQNIADMNLLLRPDLHILDATRILLRNGPKGGKVEDVEVKNLLFAGTDPVALDAYGAGLFGLKPEDLGYIVKAHQAGRGEMDLGKIKVQSRDHAENDQGAAPSPPLRITRITHPAPDHALPKNRGSKSHLTGRLCPPPPDHPGPFLALFGWLF